MKQKRLSVSSKASETGCLLSLLMQHIYFPNRKKALSFSTQKIFTSIKENESLMSTLLFCLGQEMLAK